MSRTFLKIIGDLTCALPFVAIAMAARFFVHGTGYGGEMAVAIFLGVPMVMLSLPWSITTGWLEPMFRDQLSYLQIEFLTGVIMSAGLMINAFFLAKVVSAKKIAIILTFVGLFGVILSAIFA